GAEVAGAPAGHALERGGNHSAENKRNLACSRCHRRVRAAPGGLAVPDVTVNTEVLLEPPPAIGHAQAFDGEVVWSDPDAQTEGEAAAGARMHPGRPLGQ